MSSLSESLWVLLLGSLLGLELIGKPCSSSPS